VGTVFVSITQILTNKLSGQDIDPGRFMSDFKDWKTDWPTNEDRSRFFGKDGAYLAPQPRGYPYSLKHVHLVPVDDKEAHKNWLKIILKGWRRAKSSDRHLVYVDDGKGRFLLIFILDEPSAHSVARMENDRDRDTMRGFAAIAEAFLDHGDVIA
jgi:hypothetical protein